MFPGAWSLGLIGALGQVAVSCVLEARSFPTAHTKGCLDLIGGMGQAAVSCGLRGSIKKLFSTLRVAHTKVCLDLIALDLGPRL